jgi:hypothetical protein
MPLDKSASAGERMHLVTIGLAVVVFLIAHFVGRRRRDRAKIDVAIPAKPIDYSISPLRMLFVVPFGLLIDFVFTMLILAVLFGALWVWTHFLGPIRPIHEWFS